MEDHNVASIVQSIVATFGKGYNVLRKRSKKISKDSETSDGAINNDSCSKILRNSMRHGSKTVQRQFDQGVSRVGPQFGYSDAAASLSLASTLLKLNGGLVNIIARLLDRKAKRCADLDFQSLTSLSEVCTREAVRTLQDLQKRLSKQTSLESKPGTEPKNRSSRGAGKPKDLPAPPRKHRAHPTAVSAPVANRPYWELQLVRHSGHDRSRKSSSSSKSSSSGSKKRQHKSRGSINGAATKSAPALPTSGHSTRSSTERSNTRHSNTDLSGREVSKAATKSTPTLPGNQHICRSCHPIGTRPSDGHDTSRLAGRGSNAEHSQAMHDSTSTCQGNYDRIDRHFAAAAPRRSNPQRLAARYSVASTKLGEIPMHEWAVPFDGASVDEEPWVHSQSSPSKGMRGPRLGFLNIFKKRMPQRVF